MTISEALSRDLNLNQTLKVLGWTKTGIDRSGAFTIHDQNGRSLGAYSAGELWDYLNRLANEPNSDQGRIE